MITKETVSDNISDATIAETITALACGDDDQKELAAIKLIGMALDDLHRIAEYLRIAKTQ